MTRRPSADIPVIDMWLPVCPQCGGTIDSFSGGTRDRVEPDGEITTIRHAQCSCGLRVKIRSRRKTFACPSQGHILPTSLANSVQTSNTKHGAETNDTRHTGRPNA